MGMEKIGVYLLVGLGSALGGMGRFWISIAIAERFGARFPWGTLVVNVSGSFAIGIFAALAGTEMKPPSRSSYFLTAGVCGGYTTFSAFSLQTLNLLRDGHWAWAGANVTLSILLCLLGTWAGFGVGQMIRR